MSSSRAAAPRGRRCIIGQAHQGHEPDGCSHRTRQRRFLADSRQILPERRQLVPDVGRQRQGHLGWLGQAHAELDAPQSVTLHAGRTRVVTIGGRCRRTSASSSWGRIATIAAAARKDSNPAMGRARRIARPKSTSRWTPSMCQPASAATNWRDWPARATSADVSGHAKPDSSKPFLKMEGYHMNVVPP